jgi:hypothetical protein
VRHARVFHWAPPPPRHQAFVSAPGHDVTEHERYLEIMILYMLRVDVCVRGCAIDSANHVLRASRGMFVAQYKRAGATFRAIYV